MARRLARRTWSLVAALAVMTTGAVVHQVAVAPPAAAATQNGYSFNNAWTLTSPGSTASQYTPSDYASLATNTATTTIPMPAGAVTVNASFAPGTGQLGGTNFLTNGTNQSTYGATAGTFTGAPNPADLPALGVLTNASRCNGAVGTAAHQNFNGVCTGAGTLTLNFSRAVTNPVLDLSGLGGFAQAVSGQYGRGSFVHTRWNLLTSGVEFAAPSDGRTNLAVSSTVLDTAVDHSSPYCDRAEQQRPDTVWESPVPTFAGCGSATLQGTFSSVSFRLDTVVRPYSTFPRATFDTGTAYIGSDGTQYHDNINGLNVVNTETQLLPSAGTTLTTSDLHRISLRLPILGTVGDKVFSDANRNGLQDSGESGVPGVTVTLLDSSGTAVSGVDPVTTDSSGNYLFENLPLGSYRVRFTNLPTGTVFTTADVGTNDAIDSDANVATGVTPAVTLTETAPDVRTLDAGLVGILGSIGDRVWRDTNRNGIQDAGEPNVSGVTVTLLNAAGTPVTGIDPVTTNVTGNYLFSNLPLGTYRVRFSNLPAGTVFTTQDAGTDDAVDSDAVVATGTTGNVVLTAATPDTRTVDAGIVPILGSVGDRVFLDANRNGIQDTGEAGVAGVTATLTDDNGNAVAGVSPVTTNAAGNYLFSNLPLGTYRVRFSNLPTATAFTTADAGTDDTVDSDANQTTGLTSAVTLTAANPDNRSVDAGLVSALGSIGDRVWTDTNRNGIQDTGEPNVAGVTVTLLDSSGNPVAGVSPVTTDANGNYLFSTLPLGSYRVRFSNLPAGTTFTTQDAGTNDAVDSDPVVTTGVTAAVTLTLQNPDIRTVDAGIVPILGTLGDRVFLDANRNGIQDTGELGVAGVTATLLDASGTPVAGVAPVTTDLAGGYLFDNLPLGSYRVRFSGLPVGSAFTTADVGTDDTVDSDADVLTGTTPAVTLTAANPVNRSVDAGIQAVVGTLGDRVWRDTNRNGIQDAGEPNVAGVTATLLDGSGTPVPGVAAATTDASGNYLFTNLPLGTYRVRFGNLPAGTTFTTQNAGLNPAVDSDPVVGTGVTGPVLLTVLAPDVRTVDAGIVPILGSIGDKVFRDINGNGIQELLDLGVPGVTVTLLDATGTPVAGVAPVTTDLLGNYLFSDLPLGTYRVRFTNLPAGTGFTVADAGTDDALDSDVDAAGNATGPVTLTAAAPDTRTVDAGIATSIGSIGDRVWRDTNRNGIQDAGEPNVAGVTATLVNAAGDPVSGVSPVVTDANGNYLFTNLPLGSYRVRFSTIPTGTAFTTQNAGLDPTVDSDVDPTSRLTNLVVLTVLAPDTRTVDAGIVPILGSIGDRVFLDTNRNGVQDTLELGLGGVTVTLLDATGNPVAGIDPVTTNAAGNYLFENLPLGTYRVRFSGLPAGTSFTQADAGGNDATDSDADTTTGVTPTVTLSTTFPNNRSVDAGVVSTLGSIGDRVFRDVDRDGIQDPGGPSVPGITVTLLDATGTPIPGVDPQVTDAGGNYLFTGLGLGAYRVRFSNLPAGFTFTEQNAVLDESIDSDADPSTGVTHLVFVTIDEPDNRTVDAGILPILGTLGDKVFLDVDRDGVQGPLEPGVDGVTVTLLDADGNPVPGVAPALTDATGAYEFDNLPLGTYRVRFSGLPADTAFTDVNAGGNDATDSDADPATGETGAVTLTAVAPTNLTVDAGLVTALGSIGDKVFRDTDRDGIQDAGEPGVEGVTVTLLDSTGNPVAGVNPQTTDAAGGYLFDNLSLGIYRVRFSNLPAGTRFTTQNAGLDPSVDSDADPDTGTTGPVTLTILFPSIRTVDAGVVPVLGSLGDRVFMDVNRDGIQDPGELGVAGVTATLTDIDGNPVAGVAPVTTTGDGTYLFEGVPLGTYRVRFTNLPTGATFTQANAGTDDTADSDVDPATGLTSTVTLSAANPDNRSVDAGLVGILGSIGDKVFRDLNRNGVQDTGEPGVAGVTVTLLTADGEPVPGLDPITTGSSGTYLFDELPLGTYQVGFTDLPAGTTFTTRDAGGNDATDSDVDPATGRTGPVTLTAGTPNTRTVDAGVVPILGSIGDRVFNDTNRNGIQDAGETGVAGVTATLLDGAGNPVAGVTPVTTNGAGNYQFTNLPLGTYQVRFTGLPAGTEFTQANAGDDDAVDSDAVPATGQTGPVALTAVVPNVATVDAGVVPILGSVGDRVFRDTNRNGIQDAGETGVPGATVTLTDAGGNPVAGVGTATTNGSGDYLFDNLPLGTYRVRFSNLPVGTTYTQANQGTDDTVDSDADPTGLTTPVTLTSANRSNRSLDAGVVGILGSIGDRVFADANRNGIQDGGETGVGGITVTLLDSTGTPVAGVDPVTTNGNGDYLFENVPLGTYRVRFTGLAAGTTFTQPDQGGNDETDSDVEPSTGTSGLVVLTAAEPNTRTVDAGLVPVLGSIGDRVFQDNNRNGIQDAGELGVQNVTVTLTDADGNPVAGVDSVNTDGDGNYLLENLPLGTYRVRFSNLPSGLTFTTQNAGGDDAADSDVDPATGLTPTVTLTPAAADPRTVDAGLVGILGSIGDRVFRDANRNGVQDAGETGVEGVTATLTDDDGNPIAGVDPAVTNAQGNYLFENLPLGTYRVQFSGLPTGLEFTQADAGGNDATDSDADPATGRTGPVTLTPAAADPRTVDAGLRPILGSIGDRVFNDANRNGIQDAGETGVEGITVTLLDAAGDPVAGIDPATTNAQGNYLFENLPLGTYRLRFSGLPADAMFTQLDAGGDDGADSDVNPATGETGPVTLTAVAANPRSVDAGVMPILGTLGDLVFRDTDRNGIHDAGEPGVAGVTVTLLDGNGQPVAGVDQQTTDVNGAYLFENLPLGTYQVRFTNLPAGTTFTQPDAGTDDGVDSDVDPATGTTPSVTLTGANPSNRSYDAGVIAILGSIGDRVFDDTNRNGIQDAGEGGVGGVTVTLLDGNGQPVPGIAPAVTNGAGQFLFENLPLGAYQLRFSNLPAGTAYTQMDAGGNDATDSDVDPATGRTPVITLTAAAPNNTAVDAGVVPILGSIGDQVFDDTNRNGIQDAGEGGVGGVTVTLLDANGQPVAGVDPVTTNGTGQYLFENLPLGTYRVRVSDLPAGTTYGPQNAGGDDATDSDVDPATGVSGPVTLTPAAANPRSVDAGVIAVLGSIGNKVFSDVDRDGIQDTGEPGVAGVRVTLLDGNGVPVPGVAPVTTTGDGSYLFQNLPLGTYQVRFDNLPTGATLSPAKQGGNDATDSDPDPATGRTGSVTLTAAAPNNTAVDAGVLSPLGTLQGGVWTDTDRDGIRDAGEPGQAGVRVQLLDANGEPVPGVAPVITGADGTYRFENLPMGSYRVGFSNLPAGTTFTAPGVGSDTTVDSDADPTTGRTPVVTLTPAAPDNDTVDAGVLPPAPRPGVIGDSVWQDRNGNGVRDPGDPGVAGVTVTLLDAEGNPVPGVDPVVTGADGGYRFENLPLGTYRIKFSGLPAGSRLTTPNAGGNDRTDSDADPRTGITGPITLTAARPTAGTVDAGLVIGQPQPSGTIGDSVWLDHDRDGVHDPGEPGVAGVLVTLLDANGNPVPGIAPVRTDSQGRYSFTGVPLGTYRVRFSDLPSGTSLTRANVGSDTTDSDADPATGVTRTVTLTSARPTVSNVDAGVLPRQQTRGSVHSSVWLDRNGNGVRDPGEPGVAGVTVTLLDRNGRPVPGIDPVVTGADGNYAFDNLPLGTYRVGFSNLPAGTRLTSENRGGNDGSDSDADPGTGVTAPFTLTAARPSVTAIDAGVLPAGAPGNPDQPGDPDQPSNPNDPNSPDNPDNPDNPDQPGDLPNTGSQVTPALALAGLLALLLGAGLMVVARRRRV